MWSRLSQDLSSYNFLQISFKTWMCGGQIIGVPCSVVNHNYKMYIHHPFFNMSSDYFQKNYKRVAEVWMDEYKDIFYESRSLKPGLEVGDLTKAKKLRDDLGCKSFQWFMENLLPDVEVPWPPLHQNKKPQLQNIGSPSQCLDIYKGTIGTPVIVYECHWKIAIEQTILHLSTGQLRARFKDICMVPKKGEGINRQLMFQVCKDEESQKFEYNEVRAKNRLRTDRQQDDICWANSFQSFIFEF